MPYQIDQAQHCVTFSIQTGSNISTNPLKLACCCSNQKTLCSFLTEKCIICLLAEIAAMTIFFNKKMSLISFGSQKYFQSINQIYFHGLNQMHHGIMAEHKV